MSTKTETMTPTGAEFAQLDEARLADVVRHAVGAGTDEAVEVVSQGLETVAYEIGTVSTCALLRAFGEARVEDVPRTWSAFVKVLQSARVWPMIHFIPDEHREAFLADFPWRLEIDAQQSPLREILPEGLRLADLYAVDEIDDDHATLWMEDVPLSREPWGTDRFVRAARLLGALAARRPVGSDAVFGDLRYARDPGCALRLYMDGRVHPWAGAALHNDATWSHPAMAAVLDDLGEASPTNGLRAELCRAHSLVPHLLSVVEALPQTHAHGDASPQNLLVHADRPDEFVAIDWGFNCPLAVGFDIGQLLVGLAHSGELDVEALPSLNDLVVRAYADGLRENGFEANDRDILTGHVVSTMLRSGFTAMPYEAFERPDVEDSPALRARLAERIRLTRFMLDLARATVPDVWAS
jgi:hypothetical protein